MATTEHSSDFIVIRLMLPVSAQWYVGEGILLKFNPALIKGSQLCTRRRGLKISTHCKFSQHVGPGANGYPNDTAQAAGKRDKGSKHVKELWLLKSLSHRSFVFPVQPGHLLEMLEDRQKRL